ncbi:MAG TPA: bifunctional phosphoribosylaminoimidazolecarboxamide formyltransferase/IMP cyclohydrolase [Chloroflexia bacterium]|nr:bifunctional phosphoribosylaminoimidazolecarboxamide formyltransferase/IMP cyclohydrolase [Chloroflexia bacterium]
MSSEGGNSTKRAIISVSDKSGVVEFARGLIERGFEVYSTGGTKTALTDSGLTVHSVSDLTGFPEILGGRVKTLHPGVHGGILAKREDEGHMQELSQQQIGPIDLVAVNLYPFVKTVSQPGVDLDTALENIDIGGPTMIRAAAKNFKSVLVVVDPLDYHEVLQALDKPEEHSSGLELRQKLAVKAFQHTASYDTAIAQFLRSPGDHFPPEVTLSLSKVQDLRYGENPHQIAAFYEWKTPGESKFSSLINARQLQGKELSYNNILDADAALAVVRDFSAPTVAIIKHTNPCGLSSHVDLSVAYERALAGDPISAFGGIVAVNRTIEIGLAQQITATFFEVVVAPDFTPEAIEIFKKKKSLRLLAVGDMTQGMDQLNMRLEYRAVTGGFLVQTRDALPERDLQMTVMSQREPTLEEVTNLQFAWRAVKHIKSNAIVLVKNHAIVGMGAGQPSRVDSVKIALNKAGVRAKGSVLASDAFFPKVDGVETAALGGVTAIIQPGGSISDTDVIETAIQHNLAMVFTGRRHFKH